MPLSVSAPQIDAGVVMPNYPVVLNAHFCEINADGSGEKRLLFHRDRDGNPAVSPDGNRIAFTARSDGNLEIYLMNRDGTWLSPSHTRPSRRSVARMVPPTERN